MISLSHVLPIGDVVALGVAYWVWFFWWAELLMKYEGFRFRGWRVERIDT